MTVLQVMSTLTGTESSTAQMRQLAQAEVDWTSFRSAVELHHTAISDKYDNNGDDGLQLPDESHPSYASLAGCSPRTASAADLSPRSVYSFSSPQSPREQGRPYTAPTIVSRQPFPSGTECPFYVSALYKFSQHLLPEEQAPSLVDCSQSMTDKASLWSSPVSPAHGPAILPEPFLKAKSGGLAMTHGSREHDRLHSSSAHAPPGETMSDSSKKGHSTNELITTMREGGRLVEEAKPSSRIVARSKAWPASADGHPCGSGLTVRQQACLLGKSSLAKHEEILAAKYGPWLQDLRAVTSCRPGDAQTLRAQASALMTSADDALAPRLYSMGPI